MNKINLVDLDNTLLPYDSLRRYILLFLRQPRVFFPVSFYSFLRIFRLIDQGTFLKKILLVCRRIGDYEAKIKLFSSQLLKDIDKSIFNSVLRQTDSTTVNILCTASPEDYAKPLANALGWELISSTINSATSTISLMHGENRITALKQRFPPQLYLYQLAISDNKDDIKLLALFQESFHLKPGRGMETK